VISAAPLGLARELRQDQHRHVELLGHCLEVAGDGRDLLVAAVEAGAARHQLQVVDHHQVEAALLLESPRLGRHFEGGDAGGVVDPQIDVAQRLRGHLELGPVGLGEVAAGNPFLVDPRLGGQQSTDELLGRHLEREDGDLLAAPQCGMGADVRAQRGLPHRRPRGEQNQVFTLEPRSELVEADIAGVEAGQGRAGLARSLDIGELRVGQAADRHETAGKGVLGDAVDVLLGRLHRFASLAVVERAGRDDALGGRHQLPFDCLVVDNLGVVDDVGDIGQGIDQR
jgi:hypothetical protein